MPGGTVQEERVWNDKVVEASIAIGTAASAVSSPTCSLREMMADARSSSVHTSAVNSTATAGRAAVPHVRKGAVNGDTASAISNAATSLITGTSFHSTTNDIVTQARSP